MLGSVFLALQNVILRFIFVPSSLFGRGMIGGWLEPNFTNALFLLWLRTLLMAVVLVAIAPRLHRPVFSDLRRLLGQRSLLGWVVLSGVLLAISLSLLNLSISKIETGIAIGVFFTHPAWTVLLAWGVWGDRPSRLRLWLMVLIIIGVMLTTAPPGGLASLSFFTGSLVAIGAAAVYAVYSLITQHCLRSTLPPAQWNGRNPTRLHPIPFSIFNFGVVVVTSSVILLGSGGVDVGDNPVSLLHAGFWSAIAALLAYVMLNFGVSLVGAATASLFSSTTPILTVLFAWIALDETLRSWQILGVFFVAAGITALSISRQKS
jgi:drug/metabolite transporter (DMT)-like permease